MIVIEVTGADASGTLKAFYFSDLRGKTTPTSTPASTFFDDRIIDPGNYSTHLFSDGATGGVSLYEFGEIILGNADGTLDSVISTYGFDGQQVTVRLWDEAGKEYPTNYPALFVATIDSQPIADVAKVVLPIRDFRSIFDKIALPNVYAGNNALPNGFEGTPNDIGGTRKPRVYGAVDGVPAPCVNTSLLIYQVSDQAVNSIAAVLDAGVVLTNAGNLATPALLAAASVTAGTYKTCLSGGLFRLGGAPVGLVTCNAVEDPGTGASTSPIVTRMANDAGITNQSTSDASAMFAANSTGCGIWITDEMTWKEAFDQVLAGVGGAIYFDSTNKLRRGILNAPSGSPAFTVDKSKMLGPPSIRPARDNSIPLWQVTMLFAKLYAVQTSGLAGSVTPDAVAYLSQEYRNSTPASDANVKLKHLLAGAATFESLFTYDAAAAATEATRRLNMYKVDRFFADIVIPKKLLGSAKLLDIVQVTYPRFGMDSGKLFVLTGLAYDRNNVTLTLWG